MTSGEIDYPELVDQALCGVAQRVLERVAEEGLPGEHHFLITFSTDHPDLQLPSTLRDAYPEEMTIVLQNQFWDLLVEEDAFEVSLRFGGEAHRLRVPWQALHSFVDPAAEFGLRFGSRAPETDQPQADVEPVDRVDEPGDVVSLDEFRKREG